MSVRGVRFRGGWGLRGRGMRLTGGKGEGGVRFGGGLRAGEGGRGRGVRPRGGNHCSPVSQVLPFSSKHTKDGTMHTILKT